MNTSHNDHETAVQTIKNILLELRVNRVIYIDDGFELIQNPEPIIGYFFEAYGKSPSETQSLLDVADVALVDLSTSFEIWSEDLRVKWSEMDESHRSEIVSNLSRILNKYIGNDLQSVNKLENLFPGEVELTEIGPSKWESERISFFGQSSNEYKTLCLFDQDLSQAPGYTATGSKSGIGLLQALLKEKPPAPVICALLTHTLSPENEMEEWHRLSRENNIPLEDFLPIAKLRLENPLEFATAIKKTAINKYCEQMKNLALKLIEKSSEEAKSRLKLIDVYDFEHMVLRSSLKEGVAESETLLRLYHIFHQNYVKQALLASENSESFNNAVEKARRLSNINDRLRHDRKDQRWNIRSIEMYEEKDALNRLHTHLQIGDIFCLSNEQDKLYLFIAQPCDLMVREEGFRGNNSNDKFGTLIPIEKKSKTSADKMKPHEVLSSGFLHYLFDKSEDVGISNFKLAKIVNLDILDLVTLNPDGRCLINIKTISSDPPPQLHTAWRNRWKHLIALFTGYSENIETTLSLLEDKRIDQLSIEQIKSSLMPKLALRNIEGAIPSYHNGEFDFGIKRIGRIRQPWASQLLTSYTRFLSRDANEHDFYR